MRICSAVLKRHLLISGDYSVETQAEQSWPAPSKHKRGTERRGSNANKTAPLRLTDRICGLVEGALGNGASVVQTGSNRNHDRFEDEVLAPSTARDAAHLYRPHPCKATTGASTVWTTLFNIAAAGFAASTAALAVAVPLGVSMGAIAGIVLGAGQALSSGALVGLTVAVQNGTWIGVCTALITSLCTGVIASMLAAGIAQARAQGTTRGVTLSRRWEELSGLMHVPMRIVLRAYDDAKIARDKKTSKASVIPTNDATRVNFSNKLPTEILLQILGYLTPEQRYAVREADPRLNILVRTMGDIDVACTKHRLNGLPKEIALFDRCDDESGHINPIFELGQRRLFIGQKRSMQDCSITPAFSMIHCTVQVGRQDVDGRSVRPFVLKDRPLLDTQRPCIDDGTKVRQLKVSPMHRYRSELRGNSRFYFEENVCSPCRTTGRSLETAWSTKPLFFAQDEYLLINNATTGGPDLYRTADMNVDPVHLPWVLHQRPGAPYTFNWGDEARVGSASMNEARDRLALTTRDGVLHLLDRYDEITGETWRGRYKFWPVASASFYPKSNTLLADVPPTYRADFATAVLQGFAQSRAYEGTQHVARAGIYNISSETGDVRPIMPADQHGGSIKIAAVSPDETVAIISSARDGYALYDKALHRVVSIRNPIQKALREHQACSDENDRLSIHFAPTTNRIFFASSSTTHALDRVGDSLAMHTIRTPPNQGVACANPRGNRARIGFTHKGDLIAVRRFDKVMLYGLAVP